MSPTVAKYWKGTIAVLSFASVLITNFLAYFGNNIPPRAAWWITGIGVLIGAVLSFMQEPNPLSPQEKKVIARMRLDALKQEEQERGETYGQRGSRHRRWSRWRR